MKGADFGSEGSEGGDVVLLAPGDKVRDDFGLDLVVLITALGGIVEGGL